MKQGCLLKENDSMTNKKIFLVFVILLSLNFVSAGYYYKFDLKLENEIIKFKSVDIEFSQEGNFINNYYNEENSYYLNIMDSKNLVLDKIYFSPPNFVLYDLVNDKGEFYKSESVILDELDFNIFSNYFDNGYKAIIYDSSGEELDRIFISQFAKEGFDINDFKSDKTQEKIEIKDEMNLIENNNLQKNYSYYIKILIVLLIILVIILIYTLKGNKIR